MDPNFVKLYKMAQLTIEYLLVCRFVLVHKAGSHWILCLAVPRSNNDSHGRSRSNKGPSRCRAFFDVARALIRLLPRLRHR